MERINSRKHTGRRITVTVQNTVPLPTGYFAKNVVVRAVNESSVTGINILQGRKNGRERNSTEKVTGKADL